jgi:hypothetical protein
MSSVKDIIDRVEENKHGGKQVRLHTKQDWVEVRNTSVDVGSHSVSVRTARRGGLFSVGFANTDGRPTFVTGSPEALKNALAGLVAELQTALDEVQKMDEAHKAKVDSRASGMPKHGGVQVIRVTGKTERERQRRLNKGK